jgi:hypothetical protein
VLPIRRRLPTPRLAALLPSARSVAVGFALAAIGAGTYGLARETSLFAVERIEVAGAPPGVAQEVRTALAGLDGRSLLGLRAEDVERRVLALPSVVAVRYDRAFPHALRITILPERPVAVARRGTESWLLSARGRVIRPLPRRALLSLPRIWLTRAVPVEPGATLADNAGGAPARALALLAATPLSERIRSAAYEDGELRFTLASGVELRFGSPGSLRLKLAIARRILVGLPAGTRYVDLSVPERPVSG